MANQSLSAQPESFGQPSCLEQGALLDCTSNDSHSIDLQSCNDGYINILPHSNDYQHHYDMRTRSTKLQKICQVSKTERDSDIP